MGNGQAYRDRVADGSLRTTNAPGYVSGGPASGGTDGWYDCNNIHNDSPNNTGLVEFPHETGTGMDAGKQRHVNLWYSRGNPGSANGCPVYPRPSGETAAPAKNPAGAPIDEPARSVPALKDRSTSASRPVAVTSTSLSACG